MRCCSAPASDADVAFGDFAQVADHWRAEGKRFDLATVLLYAILGMVAGAIKTAEQLTASQRWAVVPRRPGSLKGASRRLAAVPSLV